MKKEAPAGLNRIVPAVLLLLQLFWMSSSVIAQSDYALGSPDRKIEVKIQIGDRLKYSVLFNGKPLLQESTLSINIDQQTLGRQPKVKAAKPGNLDRMIEPAVRQKFARIRENYNELRLEMEGNYAVVFRAYNEGVAYRIETSLPQPEVKIYGEEALFNFAGDYRVYYPQEESFFSHNERKFPCLELKSITEKMMASLPAVVDTGAEIKLAIAESDVEDYPGLWLRGNGDRGLSAIFPPYPLKESLRRDRDFSVTEAAEYIAVTRGTRTFPWRLIAIAEKDGDLITNALVYLLARPSEIKDPSWIKPGKVAWDW
ncbi:MAG TPA: glycoside hydrolase family 97 N-terminal domain-containing protein, partial [Blastocatellia bacterium]|nr:glycoside hydrolase family 97 N-terminal domain-containing protein [Blastocatellia bacterium]